MPPTRNSAPESVLFLAQMRARTMAANPARDHQASSRRTVAKLITAVVPAISQVKPVPTKRESETKPPAKASPAAHEITMNMGSAIDATSVTTAVDDR